MTSALGGGAAADPEDAPSITLPVALPATARNLEILSAARSVLDAAMDAVNAQHEDAAVDAAFAAPPMRIWSWWRWRVGFVFALLDVCAFLAAWLLFPAGPGPATPIIVAVLAVVVGHRLDLNRSRLQLSVLEDFPAYLLVTLSCCGAALGMAAAHGDAASTFATCFLFALVGLSFVIALRGMVYMLFRRLRRTRKVAHPVVIVGTGEVGERLATAMLAHPEYGLAPIGFIDPEPTYRNARLPLPVLGGFDALPAAMREHDVNDLVFAFSGAPDAQVVRIVRSCLRMDCQVFVVPRFFELYGADRRSRVEAIWGVPVVRLRRWPLRPSHALIKRGTDIALSTLALLVLSPILAATALAVRLEGGAGIIFRQTRIGRDETPFPLYKFRSMRPADDAERDTRWCIDGDKRIGVVGRFLRRTGLDEAPQLINVLRGDMSIVGPRPERPHFVRTFGKAVHGYRDRHRVPAGLTGLAQVNGLRGNTSIDDRVAFDNYYIDNWSLWTDVKIMIWTLRTFFRRDAVTPGPKGPVEFSGRRTGRPMRVLHVARPTTEGVAVVLMTYIRDQLARGWDVVVACPPDGWLAQTAREAGARVVLWSATRSPGPSTLSETRRLGALIDAVAPDLVHLHSSKAGLAGRLAVRGRVPTVFQPHAWSFNAVTGVVRKATLMWERVAVRWTSALVYVSQGERDEARTGRIRGRNWVVTNGVDLGDLTPATAADRAAARERLGLPSGPLAVCVGRLSEQKGQLDLVDVWPEVRRLVPGATLVLVGQGPQEDELTARAADGVRLVGNREDVSEWLAAANVVVAPSRWEGMALAPIEAMARARYVIATDVAGMREALPSDAATTVAVGARSALVAAVADRLTDPEGTDAAGLLGRRHVERAHDAVAAAAGVVSVYQALLPGLDERVPDLQERVPDLDERAPAARADEHSAENGDVDPLHAGDQSAELVGAYAPRGHRENEGAADGHDPGVFRLGRR